MSKNFKMKFKLKGLHKLMKQSPKAFNKSLAVAGLQFLNWANNRSKNESAKPPIRFGVLRGSSSVFVGNKLIGIQPQNVKEHGIPTPAKSYNGRTDTMTVVWNTDYAKKMHEWKGNWSKYTIQDSNAGNKWLEKHISKDRTDIFKLIDAQFKKEIHI